MSLTSLMLRFLFQRGDNKRDAGLSTPENIERWDDLRYGDDPKENRLDIYRPKGISGKLPVIVSVFVLYPLREVLLQVPPPFTEYCHW